MIKIENVRFGFATNSSSTHSIILLPDGYDESKIKDLIIVENHYGWEEFVLSSPNEKIKYLAAQLYINLRRSKLSENSIKKLILDITGFDIEDFKLKNDEDLDENLSFVGSLKENINISIDHQSLWPLQNLPKQKELKEFLKDFAKYLKTNNYIILGGNDNSSEHWESEFCADSELVYDENFRITDILQYNLPSVIRKDNQYYTFFNYNTGSKIRFSLDHKAPPYEKSSIPELVDLKITNYCPYGCEWCYMASTKKGIHAPLEDIKLYVDLLSKIGVFEVALGGGEPTMHPDFIEIVKYIKSKKMVVNFTTFSTSWLKDEEIVKTILDNVSAIGVSVRKDKDLEKVFKIQEKFDQIAPFKSYKPKITAQHVFGGTDAGETMILLKESIEKEVHMLLLGYKDVGFGKNQKPHDMSNIIEMLALAINKNEVNLFSKISFLSVDTAFVNKFQSFLDTIEVPTFLISSPEGKFSMYIDAVTNKMGPSSYVDSNELEEIPLNKKKFLKIWEKY